MIRLLLLAVLLPLSSLQAGEGRVIKVLPHLLDARGLHTLSPSLYERDAYQARLRSTPDLARGLRFDVLWKVPKATPGPYLLRIEMRGAKSDEVVVVERPVTRGLFGRRWTGVTLEESEFQKVGSLAAWRATLRNADGEIAASSSFLW
jgi:hypothetical protein